MMTPTFSRAFNKCLSAPYSRGLALPSTGGQRLAPDKSPLVQRISTSRTPLGIGRHWMSSQSRQLHPNLPPLVSVFVVISVTLGTYLYMSAEVRGSTGNQVAIYLIPTQQQQNTAKEPMFETLEGTSLEVSKLPKEEAILATAPLVPPSITRDHPTLVQVPLTTETKLIQLTNQYKYDQWSFNGTVPGPFIRARVGDVVELTLTNRDAAGNPHNIDSHAFTGPGGGAALTTAEQDETKTARFKLLSPGLFLYHCAAAPVPVHIANGMYGLMYVQPAEGDLPPVDKEYYFMQSEFYHEPPEIDDDGRRSDVVEVSYPNGLREEPNVVVFNGTESALTRDHPLTAKVGESVRIFFGNAGPNLTGAFHVIGSHFRTAYRDGDVVSSPGQHSQTISVPPGAASIVDLQMEVPGTYTLVDHAIFRLEQGAVGFLNVSGKLCMQAMALPQQRPPSFPPLCTLRWEIGLGVPIRVSQSERVS